MAICPLLSAAPRANSSGAVDRANAAEQVIQRMPTATPPIPSAEEIAWATRKRFEASFRPLVCVREGKDQPK